MIILGDLNADLSTMRVAVPMQPNPSSRPLQDSADRRLGNGSKQTRLEIISTQPCKSNTLGNLEHSTSFDFSPYKFKTHSDLQNDTRFCILARCVLNGED